VFEASMGQIHVFNFNVTSLLPPSFSPKIPPNHSAAQHRHASNPQGSKNIFRAGCLQILSFFPRA
jgi:hypothetical protein